MKHRVGLLLILAGFIELAAIFGYNYMVQNHGWENPLPQTLDVDMLTFATLMIFVISPFMLIIIGTFCLETGSNYTLQSRKRKGLCWSCGKDLRECGPEYKCPNCGNEHDSEIIRLFLEIADRQERLRELGCE